MAKIRFPRAPRKIETWAQVKALLPREIKIKLKIQSSNYACGQTCLDMLGYDGHKMFPGREVLSSDLRSIPGTREVTVPVGEEEKLDYSYPHIWILLGKGKEKVSPHMVIRHKDMIYCPTLGKMDAHKYKAQYVAAVLQEFIVPFKGYGRR